MTIPQKHLKKTLLLLSMLAIGVGIAGCGSSGTTSAATTTSHTTTKAAFIAAGDTICQSSDAAIEPLKQRIKALEGESNASVTKSLPAILRQAVASERASLAKLQSLPEPAGETAAIAKWLTAENESVTDQSNFADALASEEGTAREAAQEEAAKAKALAHGLAQGYGFKVCGEEGGE